MTIEIDPATARRQRLLEALMWVSMLAVTFVLVWYVGDRAFVRGRLSRDQEITDANQKVADAMFLLSQCKASAELKRPIAQAQKNMADATLDAATKPSKKHSDKLSQSLHNLKALRDTPTIAGTSE